LPYITKYINLTITFLPSFCLIAFSIQFEVAISLVIRCTDARKKKLDLIRQVKVEPTISCTTCCVKDLHYTTVTKNLSKLKLRWCAVKCSNFYICRSSASYLWREEIAEETSQQEIYWHLHLLPRVFIHRE